MSINRTRKHPHLMIHTSVFSTKHIILWVLLLAAPPVFGADIYGRVTLGGFAAKETYSDTDGGSDRNDYMTASGRIFLRASALGESRNWEFVSDIRDQNDFFDKLNRERLQLEPVNTFQVRQLKVRYETSNRVALGEVGRFPVIEAGNVHCDGMLAGLKITPGLRWAAFGGLNPKRNDQTYVRYNDDSFVSGTYFKYQSQDIGWEKNLFSSIAFVSQAVGHDIDRQYIFNNSVYQWSANSRLLYFVYLDFVPHTYVQMGYLSWMQDLGWRLTSEVNGLAVDVIEYTRRQGLRERLSASAYKEGSFKLRNDLAPSFNLSTTFAYGQREADQLIKREYIFGVGMPRLLSSRVDVSLKLGYRDNFTSQDSFARFGTGYFSSEWELTLDVEGGQEIYSTGETLHPLTAEASLGAIFSKPFFIAVSVERAQDERVSVWAGFFKLTYRFGSTEAPPVRDGAAPRGRL
ncbi:MAG: hypothetical protein ABL958_05740 [Bdellovibrionia bacterium]